MNLQSELRKLFEPALIALAPDSAKVPDYLAMIKVSSNADLGDYQANFAMALAKQLGRKPPELANEIVTKIPVNDLIESATVAGPGFINIKLKSATLAQHVQTMAVDNRLGVALAEKPRKFVIDYSGPNVAKPLHVGHLRSTIIGDALVRLLRFLGHNVVGDNHLGDWGTQFGILIYGYKHHRNDAAYQADPVRELARLYIEVRKLFKSAADDDDEAVTNDPVKEACRQETAKLHAGDPENLALWQQFMPACLEMLRPIYERLDVKIDHALGESFYNPMLPGIVEDLLTKGVAVESNGAIVIPNAKGMIPKTEEEQNKEEPPALVRKRDGAFTYTTTDLATIRYRVETWHPDVILYVVDARQALHFRTLYANARRWGYTNVEFHHLQFGSILDEDGKPFQTRKGGVAELGDLIDQACALGLQKYEESHAARKAKAKAKSSDDSDDLLLPDLDDDTKQLIAETVGIGAIKYADLSGNRTSDYTFSFEKMLATDGNTATYMQYAYARCRAIFRKGKVEDSRFHATLPPLIITHNAERTLCLQLLRFEETLLASAAEYLPHLIASYLWDLAKPFSIFFVKCPVLTAETPELRESRLLLVDVTGRVIQKSLSLLGIKTVEQM